MAKLIVGEGIITNNSAKLLTNPVILEDWRECFKLGLSTMGKDRRKCKKCLRKSFCLIVDELCADSKEEFLIWRSPDINGEVDCG